MAAWSKVAQEVREHVRYRLDNWFARGTGAQVLLLTAASALVVLAGMSTYWLGLFAPENAAVEGIRRDLDQGLADSFWWSINHVLDPSASNSDYRATWPVVLVSFGLCFAGLGIFGTLVGLVSSAIEGRLATLRSGNGVVKERDHLLILGWNDKIFSILRLLSESARPVTVVVLCEHEIDFMKGRVRTEATVGRNVRLVFRTGDPTNLVELERVAFDKAFNLVVLADESGSSSAEDPDIRVIKTLIQLSSYREWGERRPKMAAEIIQRGYFQAASIAAAGEVTIVNSSATISKLLVQASRQPDLSIVYRELFGFSGSEIFVAGYPELQGQRFGELWPKFANAIPIGVSRMVREDGRDRFVPHLNPGADYRVAKGEWLIFVSRGRNLAFDPLAPPYPGEVVSTAPLEPVRPSQVLVLGWNESIYDIVTELDRNLAPPGMPLRVVAHHAPEVAAQLMTENLSAPSRNVAYSYVQQNYAKREHLSELLGPANESVILLADRSLGDDDPDARTIITLLSLRDVLRERGESAERLVATEFLHPQNADLLMGQKLGDMVISPEMVSMVLTQVSQQLMLKLIYEELLDAGGCEVYLKPASLYTTHPAKCTFADVISGSLQRGEIAIGLRLDRSESSRANNFGVIMNPPKDLNLELGPQDRVVVVARDG